MKRNILYFAISIFIFSSCAVVQTKTSKTFDIYGAGVVQNPVLVDLDVKEEKVMGQAKGMSSNLDAVKNNAVANALEKANADVLVEPAFETKTQGSQTIAIVKGFPATYKNFRPLKENDLKLLEAGITQKANVKEPKKIDRKKNKGTGWGIFGMILAVGATVLIATTL